MKRRTVLSTLAALPLGALPVRGLAQSAAGSEPYKIGFTTPLTGALSSLSTSAIAAVELGVADVNRAGGIKGHQLVLLTEDSAGTPEGGIAAMRKLVQVNGVAAIITIYTNVVVAQMPLADQLTVPTISPIETPDIVSKSVYSFAHSQTMAQEVPLLRDFWRRLRYKKIFALLPNNSFGTSLSPQVRGVAQDVGASYDEVLFEQSATDFRGVVARIKDVNPDAIFIAGQGNLAETRLMQQIREGGLKTQFFNPAINYYEPSWNAAGAPYAEGMYYCGLNVDESTNPQFVRDARAKLGRTPGYFIGEFFDMVKIYAYAIDRAGYSGPAIRNAVASLSGLRSVLGGTITMGPDHYTRNGGSAIWQVRNGALVKVTS